MMVVRCSFLSALCYVPTTAMAEPQIEVAAARAWTNQAATPLNIAGLPNAFKVSDTLYRGAQPTPEGFQELKKLGIKTVVCLRAFHTETELVKGAGLDVEQIPMKTWHAEDEDIVRFLQIVTDTHKTPVFVHCRHGADRTGVTCAIYRVAVCGWSKEDAIDEMVNGGFNFHKTWRNLITFLENIDIESIKKKADLK